MPSVELGIIRVFTMMMMMMMMMNHCHQSKGLWNEPMIGKQVHKRKKTPKLRSVRLARTLKSGLRE